MDHDSHIKKCLACAGAGAFLFFVLSPGVLLTLPPKCKGKWLLALKDDKNCCSTSYFAAFIHAIVFAIVSFFLCFFLCKN